MNALKKVLAFIKFITVGIFWSCFYLYTTLLLFKSIWGFNYLSGTNWSIISTFWSEGGKIKSGSDYLFVLCVILLIPLWIWGWKKLYKASWLQIMLLPVTWYQNRKTQNYLKSMSRIKIHNIGISIGADVKEDFENKLKKQRSDIENSPKASQNIRSQINNRLKNTQ